MIGAIEFRTEQDPDVARYTHPKDISSERRIFCGWWAAQANVGMVDAVSSFQAPIPVSHSLSPQPAPCVQCKSCTPAARRSSCAHSCWA